MNDNPEIEQQNHEMTFDESIIKNRDEGLTEYIIHHPVEQMENFINKNPDHSDLDGFKSILNKMKNMSNKGLEDLYKVKQKTFQGHKSISGQTLEKPIEKKLREEGIPYVAQGKISNDGRLMSGRINGVKSISLNTFKKQQLQKLAEHLEINTKKDNGTDKTNKELKENICDKIPCLHIDNKKKIRGLLIL